MIVPVEQIAEEIVSSWCLCANDHKEAVRVVAGALLSERKGRLVQDMMEQSKDHSEPRGPHMQVIRVVASMASLPWRPHTEHPRGNETAWIAIPAIDDVDGSYNPYMRTTLYCWDEDKNTWICEQEGDPIDVTEFWWLPEQWVLDGLTSDLEARRAAPEPTDPLSPLLVSSEGSNGQPVGNSCLVQPRGAHVDSNAAEDDQEADAASAASLGRFVP